MGRPAHRRAGGDPGGQPLPPNQSLVLGIFGLLGVIPCVGWVWAVFVAVWWCMGLTGAIRGVERPVPVLGGIRILL